MVGASAIRGDLQHAARHDGAQVYARCRECGSASPRPLFVSRTDIAIGASGAFLRSLANLACMESSCFCSKAGLFHCGIVHVLAFPIYLVLLRGCKGLAVIPNRYELHGVGDDVSRRSFGRDHHKTLTGDFKSKHAQRNETPVDRRRLLLVDANRLLAISAEDGDRYVG